MLNKQQNGQDGTAGGAESVAKALEKYRPKKQSQDPVTEQLEAEPNVQAASETAQKLKRKSKKASDTAATTEQSVEPAVTPGASTTQMNAEEKVAAFNDFKRTYAQMPWIDNQKTLLKQKYSEAKALGEQAQTHRNAINEAKAAFEKRQMELMLTRPTGSEIDQTDAILQQHRQRLENERTNYKDAYSRLKDLKIEIEHLQHLLENARVRMQRDFEQWLQRRAVAQERPTKSLPTLSDIMKPILPKDFSSTPALNPPKDAWRTPTESPYAALESTIRPVSRPVSAKNPISASTFMNASQNSVAAVSALDKVQALLQRAGVVLENRTVENDLAAFMQARNTVASLAKRQ